MATDAIAGHARVGECGIFKAGEAFMAVFAHIARLNVAGGFPDCGGAIVAADAIAGHPRMRERWRRRSWKSRDGNPRIGWKIARDRRFCRPR